MECTESMRLRTNEMTVRKSSEPAAAMREQPETDANLATR
jgi:hypothetical protein